MFDLFHLPMQGAQKPFHRRLSVFPFDFKELWDQYLMFEVELIAFATCQVVQMVPYPPDIGEGFGQIPVFFMRQMPLEFEVPDISQTVFDF